MVIGGRLSQEHGAFWVLARQTEPDYIRGRVKHLKKQGAIREQPSAIRHITAPYAAVGYEPLLELVSEGRELVRQAGAEASFLGALSCSTGLLNQSSTCYLNCILHALYGVPQLRQAVFDWSGEAAMSPAQQSTSVILQVQRRHPSICLAYIVSV